MSHAVFYSEAKITAAAGFGKVAHLPCIFDSRPGYHRDASRYLIDRGLGIWNPETRGRTLRALPPTDQTIKNYAYWLVNFLDWAEVRGVEIRRCDYVNDVQGRYQTEMLKGIWSRDKEGLSPTTVNLRVQQACDFLTWMSDKKLRDAFDVPTQLVRVTTRSATSSIGHRSHEVAVRKGKVRLNKRRLRMPTDIQTSAWLGLVYEAQGNTLGLMCETVMLTAARRAEISCWRVDTLPEAKAEWHISNPLMPAEQQRVLVTLKFGTKGPCFGYDHGDKVGPERSIWIPLSLAERLHEYRHKLRNPALRQWVKSATTAKEREDRRTDTVHLFLDEQTGERLTDKHLYNAWTSVELPFKGWSPHLGRDWWACSVLWAEMQKHQHLLASGQDVAIALLESTAISIIRLQIRPQLGHADDSTTMRYLQWVADMMGFAPTIKYESDHEAAVIESRGRT